MNYPIIDSHCHVYPDKIASKAVEGIGKFYDLSMYYDGKYSTLVEFGSEIGVKHYVIFSVATTPHQVHSINTFIAETVRSSDGLVTGLGALHPDSETIEEDIEEIIASNKNSVVLIDEAYIDFGGTSCYELIRKYDNLIVCRTFSKAYSLAGARLGYCFANEELIKDLEKIKYSTNPYNINRLTQKAGVAAMAENDYYMTNCKKIADTRQYTAEELSLLGFEVLSSKANFIFAKHESISGADIYTLLRERGILVRHFTDERIKDYNRITIGSREEMEALVKAMKEIVKGV